ncbi:hypothetical protein C9374_010334 [Naegleria lovaniensis]|uniref:START domain-containing protein n=1 Tax=Naegleria lovaniensis TaxID=51637 RepID=A0AA88KDS6_NAELO|nr:uncharacterized protein C9374_010334 [Naegleria lovaniensis]KAG2374960.1 hypothetical protein C9374_010334 [Naegleria lovaniensis]
MNSSDSSNPSIRSSLKQHWYQAREKGLKLSSPEVLHDGTTFKYYHTKNDLLIFVKEFDAHTMRSDIVEKWHDEEGDWFVQYFASPSLGQRIDFHLHGVPEGYQLPSNIQPVKGAVRGENIFSTLRLKQLENGDLKMVYVNQAKPNGWIPFSIINASIYGVPQVLRQTALYLRKTLRHLTKYEEGSTNLK